MSYLWSSAAATPGALSAAPSLATQRSLGLSTQGSLLATQRSLLATQASGGLKFSEGGAGVCVKRSEGGVAVAPAVAPAGIKPAAAAAPVAHANAHAHAHAHTHTVAPPRPSVIAEAVDAAADEFANLGPRDVHPWHKPAQPSHEAMKASPHRPVFVTANPIAGSQRFDGSADPARELSINGGAMEIETDAFSGRVEIHLKGLGSTRRGVFDGKKRYFQVALQGRFKRPVDAAAVCIGQEFVKPGSVPPWVGELVLTAAAKVFSSSAHVDVHGKLPYFMNPVLAACQMVNVSEPGSEPTDLWAAQEDMRLFSPGLSDRHGRPLPSDRRRKWCDVPRNLEGLEFKPDHVYTLHIWQHLIDFSSYKLSVGGFVNLDLAAALNSQPLQLTCKDIKSGGYMFSMLVWHERLLYDDETSSQAANLAQRFAGGVGSGLGRLFGRGAAAAPAPAQ